MRVRLPPLTQEIQKLMRRFDPDVRCCLTPFRTHEHSQSPTFKGLESVLVGGIVAQISHGRTQIQLSENFADCITLVRFWRTHFNAAIKFQ